MIKENIMNNVFEPVKQQLQAKELKDAATEAVFGLQLSKDKAIRFILRNVKGANVKQARKALEFACTSYKMEEPDYNF
jgi:hypothetical protein